MKKTFDLLARKRHWLLWTAALGFGAVGVAGTHGFIAEQLDAERLRLQADTAPVRVLVAGVDLTAGARLDGAALAVRELPAKYLPASAVMEGDYEMVEGQVIRVAMRKGEPLLATTIDNAEPAFSDRVRAGIRAMTISVDEVNSVSGMLRPGDRIDLLFSTQTPGITGMGSEITTSLMADLKVLATGRDATALGQREQVDQSFSTITVEVSPEQAQKLVLAQRSGRLTALLRNPGDRNPLAGGSLDLFSLLGIKKPSTDAGRRSVEVIVGGQGTIDQQRAGGNGGSRQAEAMRDRFLEAAR